MIKKTLNFINREIEGLHKAAYLLSFFAVMSQVLGLIRDRLLAAVFGASRALDVYYAAFRIPDFIFITVGSMVSVSVLIPFLMQKMEESNEASKKFIGNVFLFFFLLIVAASGAAFFLIPGISPFLFPGFDAPQLAEVVVLTRVLLLSPIFLGLSNILGTLTQAHKRFLLYALSPLLYNLGIIAGIIFLYPRFGLIGLAYGLIFGAFLHLSIQLPFILKHNLLPNRLDMKFNWTEIKKVFLVSVPRTFTLGSDNISVIFLISFASLMTAGSIAVFNFSYNLQSVPLSIVGISYSLAAFPILIKYFLKGEIEKFRREAVLSAQHIIFWSVPFATLLVVLRAQIVRTILGAGRFSWSDTRLTAAALAIFATSIVFQNLTLLFVRAYYAAGNTAKPFIAKFINAASTVILGYFFMVLYRTAPAFKNLLEEVLRVQNVPGTIVLALPLGWSIGELFNTAALWLVFEKDFKNFSMPVLKTAGEVFLGSAMMGIVSYRYLNIFDKIFNLRTSLGIFAQGFLAGVIGILSAVAVLFLIDNSQISEIWLGVKNKILERR